MRNRIVQALFTFKESDLFWSFRHSPVAIIALIVTVLLMACALFAQSVAPFNPYDLAGLDLMSAHLPPSWSDGGDSRYWLGTDDQGRDLFSTMLYGLRLSLKIGLISVVLSLLLGVCLGLISGFVGGRLDAFIMRVCDVMLSFPAILIALLIDGIARASLSQQMHDELAEPVLILAITLSGWVQYARTVRGQTLVEKQKDYVSAAKLIGAGTCRILFKHLMPNVMSSVLVLATVHVGTAVITEATLSFLGVGVPPTTPSLGTLIRAGNEFLFSGEWWITIFPGLTLVALVLSVNLLGDWLRDALNPKLR